jgi:integrase
VNDAGEQLWFDVFRANGKTLDEAEDSWKSRVHSSQNNLRRYLAQFVLGCEEEDINPLELKDFPHVESATLKVMRRLYVVKHKTPGVIADVKSAVSTLYAYIFNPALHGRIADSKTIQSRQKAYEVATPHKQSNVNLEDQVETIDNNYNAGPPAADLTHVLLTRHTIVLMMTKAGMRMTETMLVDPDECAPRPDGSITFHVRTKGSTGLREITVLPNRRQPLRDLVAHITALRDFIQASKRARVKVADGTLLLYRTADGLKAMTYQRVRGAVKMAMDEVGLKSRKPYDLKKMTLTKLADSGKVKPEELAAFARHKTPQVYQTYYVDRHKGKVCADVLNGEDDDGDDDEDDNNNGDNDEDNGDNEEDNEDDNEEQGKRPKKGKGKEKKK